MFNGMGYSTFWGSRGDGLPQTFRTYEPFVRHFFGVLEDPQALSESVEQRFLCDRARWGPCSSLRRLCARAAAITVLLWGVARSPPSWLFP